VVTIAQLEECTEPGARSAIRVFLVDDHEFVRLGLRTLIAAEPDMEFVGEAASVAEAVALIGLARPDVVLIDLRLRDGSGVDLCRRLLCTDPHVRCVIVTGFGDERAAEEAVIAGARGFVGKQQDSSRLLVAVREVHRGRHFIDPALADRVRRNVRTRDEASDRLGRLTSQERRILGLIADGKTNRQISSTMCLSEKTVRNYVSRLLAKLGMARRSEAAGYAGRMAERGIFDLSS
jgi:DNA-binding NarL/FixJ family response regulator